MIVRRNHRWKADGLTLVEVVAALVLLSILGMTLLPILTSARSATRAAALGAPSVSRQEFGTFADEWLDSKEAATLDSAFDVEHDLSTSAGTLSVRIRSIGPASVPGGHQWLAFECSDATVLRCTLVEVSSPAEPK